MIIIILNSDMENCYICGKKLSNDGTYGTVKRHKEHIIHNGIYGKLKSSIILCEKCGGAYSKSDAKFVELFSGFIEVLRDKLISKDHGTTSAKRLKGFLYLTEDAKTGIEFCGNKAYPVEPYYEIDQVANIIKIYGQKNRIKQYQNIVKKDHPECSDYAVEFCDDISALGPIGLFFSEGNKEFNSIFQEGMCKIATEFALHHGLKVDDLPYTLKLSEHNTTELISGLAPIVPYIPHSATDAINALIEDYVDLKYPLHILRLYSEPTADENGHILVCYIELFSTFKFYVLLNNDYKGPDIDKWYCQTIISEQDEEGNPQNPDLDIEKVLESKKNRTYQILATYIRSNNLPSALIDANTTGRLIDEAISNEGLEQFTKEMLDQLSPDNYMKNTVYHYDDADPSYVSIFTQCFKAPTDKTKNYTYFKFNQLDRFCWNYHKIIKARNN